MNRIGLTILSSFQNYNNKMGLGSLTLIIFKRAPCLQINLNCLTDVRSTKRVSFWTFNWATERRVLSGVFYWVDVALVHCLQVVAPISVSHPCLTPIICVLFFNIKYIRTSLMSSSVVWHQQQQQWWQCYEMVGLGSWHPTIIIYHGPGRAQCLQIE